MKKILIYTLALLCTVSCSRMSVTKQDDGIIVTTPGGKLALTVFSNTTIHVRFADGEFSERKSLVVLDGVQKKTDWNLAENDAEIILSTSAIQAHISKSTAAVTFTDANGTPVLKEAGRLIKDTVVLDEQCKKIEQKFEWQGDEGLYGLGQYQDGLMNYRGHSRKLYQQNIVDVTPVLISSKGYGIYWENYSITDFIDTLYKEGQPAVGSLFSEVADQIDYYFIYGPETDKVIAGLRDLTGKATMFGRWAYGLWQCKEHYHTQAEILDVADNYRKRNIPVDNIVQDWFYWEPKPWGSHTFDRPRYPDADALTKTLHDKYHMQIMISVWAKFEKGSDNYNEMNQAGFLYPPTYNFDSAQYYDVYNPEARKMYWKQMNDSVYKRGFDAWWLDATEPEMGDFTNDTVKKAMKNYLGSGARYLNTYSLMTTKAVYEGQRSVSEKKRVFILTRSNYIGQQRNAAASWSGDIHASWQVFHNQISGGLNMGLSGLPYWTTDIGAFFVDDFAGGNQNKEYQELFLRWFQFGAFCPLFRVHGTSTPREMYKFGEKGYWAYDAQLKIDQLRYKLMPYIYSQAWNIYENGSTLMRGLVFDFREDAAVRNIDDQFMFGPSMLVNPVTESMYYKDFENIQRVAVTIPAENLFSPDGNTPGLTADYYNDEKMSNKVLSRIDPKIDFDWGFTSPDAKVNTEAFSAVWKGQVLADQSGEYSFVTSADDGVRLKINNKVIIDNWEQQAVTYTEGKIVLEKGKKYDICVEYFDHWMGASVKLAWITPSMKAGLGKIKSDFLAQKIKTRKVYLPKCAGWYDFWTNQKLEGGQTIDAPAPIDQLPLYVKAGSIIPMGPLMNYTTEKACDPIEVRIYPGANAEFVLYEDENDNYNYEKGAYALIPMKWDDASATLTIGARKGEFPGMMKEHTFNVVVIGEKNSTRSVTYTGEELQVK